MPLVAAKCTQCGANLEVDSTKDATVCPHCNTPFITEKAINNYNTYQNYTIANANIQLNDENSIEKRLENAEIFLTKVNDKQKALKLFQSVTNDAPGNYKGWWGIVRVETCEFTDIDISISNYNALSEIVKSALNVAAGSELEKLNSVWEEFSLKVQSNFDKVTEEQRKRIENINDIDRQMKEINDNINFLEENLNLIKKKSVKGMLIPGIMLAVISSYIISQLLSYIISTQSIQTEDRNMLLYLCYIFGVLLICGLGLIISASIISSKRRRNKIGLENHKKILIENFNLLNIRRNELYNLYSATKSQIS